MKTIRFFLLFLAAASAFSVSECTRNSFAKGSNPGSAEEWSAFSVKIFAAVASDRKGENTVISPVSIWALSALIAEAASLETAREAEALIGVEKGEGAALPRRFFAVRDALSEASGAELSWYDGFFFDPDRLEVQTEFNNTLLRDYRANYRARDFDDPATVEYINAQVKSKTRDKIENVIDAIPAETAGFFINAIHFKADWIAPFDEDLTRSAAFTTRNGDSSEVQMMQQTARVNTLRAQSYTAAELFFADSAFSLIAVRPNDFQTGKDPDHEGVLDLVMRETFTPERIALKLPRTSLEFGESLIPAMKSLGLSRVFSEAEADLSSMGKARNGRNLHIDLLRHDAVLNIDERGAEGAAVTTAGFSATSIPPTVAFDVPYHLVLRHVATGIPVFIAYVNDPRSAENHGETR